MKSSGKYFRQVIIFLLIVLWVYAPVSKLLNFEKFKADMMRQPVGYLLRIILIHVLPISELWIAALLVWKKTQEFGLYLSLFFLATFSIYIAMGMLHYFGNIPCSCGGILENMGWKIHLWFNLIFLTCTLITIITRRKEAELQD